MPIRPNRPRTVFPAAPALLLAVSVLAYGLFLPRLGFAWDDLLTVWIRYRLGAEAMARCFDISRPALGWFFQLTTAILPPVPAYWHIFAIFWRWAGAAALWALVRSLWPGRGFLAAAASLLFLVYPGFSQQFVAYTYSHYLAILAFFLLSILFTVWSLRRPRLFWPLTAAALLLSAANLLALEYFFLLELLRPFVTWIALRTGLPEVKPRLRRTVSLSLPYLGIFLAAAFGRAFLFPNQLYAMTALDAWQSAPGAALLALGASILKSLWLVTGAAWGQAFRFPAAGDGSVFGVWLAVVALAGALTVLAARKQAHGPDRSGAARAVWLGVIAMLLAGWPFWLIRFNVALNFPSDRFTLPFMLGVSLLAAGLLEFVPVPALKVGLLAALVGLAAGRQVTLADAYAREWELQKALFWQMAWRVPALEPGTLVFLNDSALTYYADNSLSAALNWTYAPANRSDRADYWLFHPRSRLGGSLPALEPGLPIHYSFYAGTFDGNTTRSLALDYSPPGCLRVLDPDLDTVNPVIHPTLRAAASFSQTDVILPAGSPLLPALYGPEPEHGWCWYFEKADLARQQGNWREAVALGDEAMSQGYFPALQQEWLVFIEAYAHTGAWMRAQAATADVSRAAPYLDPLLCRLWDRIVLSTPDTPERRAARLLLAERPNCYP
ncbi:MAG: hypothetical protein FD146_2296 [Anaerolineaceae bacterium]|nr:MAG: hypothetical protein FD146_2296 [Anaerolineaceae bacterium]